MRRRLLGTLLWCVLVPVAGFWRLLIASLRLAVGRVERVFLLGGLAVALSVPSPLTAQLSLDSTAPDVRTAISWVLAVLGAGVLIHGLRSPGLKRFRRLLQRRGWFLWGAA